MADKPASAKTLRGVPPAELQGQIETLRRDLWTSRLQQRAGTAQQPHRLRGMRRQIARLLTVLRESARGAAGSTKP
jgi:large subunit ribosomal protein L29